MLWSRWTSPLWINESLTGRLWFDAGRSGGTASPPGGVQGWNPCKNPIRQYYYAGAQRIAMRENGTLSYLLSDHLGSTSITANGSGVKVAELRYKAWGETRYTWGTTPTTYRYTGQREDSYINMYYMGARWYDQQLGRWISPDTIIPQPDNPQSLNRYSYVRNAPLRYIDPSGHWDEESAGDIIQPNLEPPVEGPIYTTPYSRAHRAVDIKAASDETNSSWFVDDMVTYSENNCKPVAAAAAGTVVAKGKGATDSYGWDISDGKGNKLFTVYGWDKGSWQAGDYATPDEYINSLRETHADWSFEGWDLGRSDYIDLGHAGGYTTRYFHTQSNLMVGDTVEMGAQLGCMNMSGPTTALHLHFQFKMGPYYIDPYPFLTP